MEHLISFINRGKPLRQQVNYTFPTLPQPLDQVSLRCNFQFKAFNTLVYYHIEESSNTPLEKASVTS